MPPRNDDLFQRLRRAGIRKPVAKALSELTEDAGKKAIAAGHRAVAELRALADELEKRLPPAPVALATPAAAAPEPAVPLTAARPRTPRPRTKAPSAAPRRTTPARSTTRSAPKAAQATKTPAAAPRGENKAKILAALASGPQTASEISQQTGIATATVSAALTRLSKAGEVTKATRGYALPS